MIKISDKYDIVLTFSRITEITGHIFECFDYWIILRTRYNVGILFLDTIPMDKLKLSWESKYNISFNEVIQDIIYIDSDRFKKEKIYMFNKKTIVFLVDGDILALERNKIFFVADKFIGFKCANQPYEKTSLYKNMIYLQDYRLYTDNHFFKTFNYVKKIPFEYYKECNRQTDKNIGLIYMTFNCRKITPNEVARCHEMSGCEETILAVPDKRPEYNNIQNVKQIVMPIFNLFDSFDTYIYTSFKNPKNGENFDCSPRLLTESVFYKKRIVISVDYTDIGFNVRFSDAKQCIEKLFLTETDMIFDIIETIR